MKKQLLILFAGLLTFSSCEDNEPTETKAGIIAEDFVKKAVKSEKSLEIIDFKAEKEYEGAYHVVYDIKTINGLGMMVPAKVSLHIKYNGEGDWTDKNNWTLVGMSILNEATGTEERIL